eukprot:m.147498 g.147498  ORF g.147498 m.147498 type:complete len:339 (+) comp30540_c3_seq2:1023-2039(+)
MEEVLQEPFFREHMHQYFVTQLLEKEMNRLQLDVDKELTTNFQTFTSCRLIYQSNLQTGSLGSGNYGVVLKMMLKADARFKTDQSVAVKIHGTKNKSGALASKNEAFVREGIILAQFQHANVVKFINLVSEDGALKIVMEFCEHGTLSQWISKSYKTSKSDELVGQAIQFCKDVAEGLQYICAKHFVHRDVASRNVLIGRDAGLLVAKVSDFGLAQKMSLTNDKMEYRGLPGDSVAAGRSLAPECENGDLVFSEKTDVYAYGVLLEEFDTSNEQLLFNQVAKQCKFDDPQDRKSFTEIVTIFRKHKPPTQTTAPAQELPPTLSGSSVDYKSVSYDKIN